jgi:DNA (cytosine-5)-methyltransferase 1
MCADAAPTLDAAFHDKQGLDNQHINGGGAYSLPPVSLCLSTGVRIDAESETLLPINGGGFDVAHALRGEGFDASEDGTGRGTPIVPVAYGLTTEQTPKFAADLALTLTKQSPTGGGQVQAVAIQERAISENPDAGPDGVGVRQDGASYTLEARQVPQAVAFAQNPRDEVRLIGGDGAVVGALGAEPGMKQQAYIAFSAKDHGGDAMDECSPTLRAGGFDGSHANGGVMPAVAFDMRGREGGAQLEGPHDTANIRAASGGSSRSYVAAAWQVRRLTPVECERLQAFPENFTRIPYRNKPADLCPDGPRYKALGNSWAVNCAEWIGERMAIVETWSEA